jgi:hypothetical protein
MVSFRLPLSPKYNNWERKIAWPLLSTGTLGGIIAVIMYSNNRIDNEDERDSLQDIKEDVMKTIKVLLRPCQELHVLFQEGIERVPFTLENMQNHILLWSTIFLKRLLLHLMTRVPRKGYKEA